MENIKNIFQETLEVLRQLAVKHEYTQFQSGAIMLDVWFNDKFYVIQFEEHIGISEINEANPGFDTIPDEKFYTHAAYKDKLNSILSMPKQ